MGYSRAEILRRMPDVFGQTIYALYPFNPMVGVIDGFRWAIGGPAAALDWNSVLISILVTGLIMVFGLRHFRATEETFADII